MLPSTSKLSKTYPSLTFPLTTRKHISSLPCVLHASPIYCSLFWFGEECEYLNYLMWNFSILVLFPLSQVQNFFFSNIPSHCSFHIVWDQVRHPYKAAKAITFYLHLYRPYCKAVSTRYNPRLISPHFQNTKPEQSITLVRMSKVWRRHNLYRCNPVAWRVFVFNHYPFSKH